MATPTAVRNLDGLSNDEILRYCPSVFAEQKHESRSDRYTYIPTSQLLTALAQVGYIPTNVMQSGSRIQGKEAYTKHLVRLRHSDNLGYRQDDVHEILLENSHDGTSSYILRDGVFRLVCTNGLIRGDINNTMKVYHRGNIVEEVVESTLALAERGPEVLETVQEMKAVTLERREQLLLAEFGMKARFDLDEPEEQAAEAQKALVPYQPADFLRTRRHEDQATDIYTTMNKVQENLLKGGIRRRDARGQVHSTREVRGIDQTVRTNKLLWGFSQRLLEFKQG